MTEIEPLIFLLALFCSFLGAVGQILLKVGADKLQDGFLSWITNLPLLAGVLLYGVAAILFIYALKSTKVSILYPIIATSYIWVAILSKILLNETIQTYNWIGIALIVFGVGVIVK